MEKTLWKNKWIEVINIDDWYTAVRSLPGDGVAVLGYDNSGFLDQFLVRLENCPPHHGKRVGRTSLTGTIEDGLSPIQTAKKELLEESGFDVDEQEIIELGWVYPVKFSDFKQYLFAVNLAGKKQGRIKGDGTKGEDGASVEWVTMNELLEVNDPSIGMTLSRLRGLKG